MNNAKLKQMACVAIVCAGGTSAFAGNGSLFGKNANTYDTKAVDDMVAAVEYVMEAGKDGVLDSKEKTDFFKLQKKYDLNYGEGSFKFVFNEMNEYSKTSGGQSLAQSAIEKGINPLKPMAERSIKNSANQQKTMKTIDMLLKVYEYGR